MTQISRHWMKFLIAYIAMMLITIIPWSHGGSPLKLYPVDVRRTFVLIVVLLFSLQPALRSQWKQMLPAECKNFARIIAGLFGTLALCSVILESFAFRFGLFDVGIFHQAIQSFVQDGTFFTSISGSGNHLKDHLSPSFVLLAPWFWMTRGAAWTLPVAHVAIVGIGALAWVRIAFERAKDHEILNHLVIGVCLFICTFDSLWLNFWWGFHETAIAFAAWSWFFALRFTARPSWGRDLLLVVILIIGAGSKETAVIEGASLAFVSAILDGRERRYPQVLLWLAIVVGLLGGLMWFEGLPKPADKNYFIRYYGYLGTNPQDAVRTLLQDPLKPFREIGIGPMLNCAWQILSPWLGLPLFAFFLPNLRKNWTWLWALAFIPSAGLLFLSTTPALRDSSFHYMISLWPLLGVLTILVLSELKKPSLIWAWVLIAAMTQGKDAWVNANLAINDLYKYGFSDEAFRNFPPGTKIAADQRAGACIANEHQVVRWPELAFFGGQCPDVVLIHREHMATDLDHPCLVGTKLQRREEFGPWIKIWLHASDVK